jgi:hypothetical protein
MLYINDDNVMLYSILIKICYLTDLGWTKEEKEFIQVIINLKNKSN